MALLGTTQAAYSTSHGLLTESGPSLGLRSIESAKNFFRGLPVHGDSLDLTKRVDLIDSNHSLATGTGVSITLLLAIAAILLLVLI